ncbi:MAG TPA: YdjY domain-containing protein, partial [Pirellulales bacterium]|nr:YdjY domain-containing protein [Pirellulales bacterium]
MKTSFLISTLFVGSFALGGRLAAAQEIDSEPATAEASEQDSAQGAGTVAAPKSRSPKKLPPPEGARRLSPDYDVWVDPKEGIVIVDGQVSLREGMLEMLACTRNTKEHEAIVSANTKAYLVHAGLVAIGATPGHPVQFVPEYKPPTGTEIEVLVQWIDDDGDEQTLRAQEWIKDISTNKEMTHPWVFGGSSFWTDPETGKKYYQAEG